MNIKSGRINYDFHDNLNYQKKRGIPNTKMFFKPKKIEPNKENLSLNEDLAIITKMNQEFARSLDLKETLNNSLELISDFSVINTGVFKVQDFFQIEKIKIN